MKKIFTSLTFLVCVLMMLSLASCVNIDETVNEATAPLNEQISSLKGEIADLNSDIADLNGQIDELENGNEALQTENEALESEKAKLEAEKTALEAELEKKKIELACAEGEHVWDSVSEVEYVWSDVYDQCIALYDCMYCDQNEIMVEPERIFVGENGELVAEFKEFPSTSISDVIAFTGVAFNSESEGYDKESNTFYVSEENKLVVTFTGTNLDKISEDKNYVFSLYFDETWHVIDYIYGAVRGIVTTEKNKITYTLDYQMMEDSDAFYETVYGLALYDANTFAFIGNTYLELTIFNESSNSDTPANEWTVVTTADELMAAAEKGGKIKFGGDIESQKGVLLYKDTVIDLAGYDLIVTGEGENAFWNSNNVEIFDSVGGSVIYPTNYISGGTFKFIGNISIENDYYPEFNGWGSLDLSEYTGDELYVYAGDLENIVISDGYAFYDSGNNKLSDFAAAKEEGYVYIRPDLPTDEWTVVTTAEELAAAVETGGKIKFGADIVSENGFDVYHEAVIDLAGYDLNVTGEYQSTFWIVADNVEVLDSVGGSAFYKQIMSNGGKLKISGSIKFNTDAPACMGNGDIDLSGYTGDEIYISCHGNLTIPEGYSYYDALGNKVENPSDGDLIYVRKDSTDTPAD